MANLSLSTDSISTLSSEISADDEYFHGQRSDSFGTSVSEDEDHDHFQHDASNNLYESMRDGVSSDVVALELVSLRMSANASDHQVRHAVASSFMKRISQLITEAGKGAGDAVHDVFTRYKDIVDRCLFDKNKEQKTDQIDLLLQIQQDLVHRTKGDTILLFAAKELYDLDIIEEEAFEAWWADERSTATEEMKKVRAQTQQFVDWLANASEEEDDDDDSEEDESEDDDEEEDEDSDE
jgi:translation initiation factor eIF-2B subunit epsilon